MNRMKRVALLVLIVILAATLWRLNQKQAEIAEVDRLDRIFGEIADQAQVVVYLEEDLAIVKERERCIEVCLQEAVERRTWDVEIREGRRCFYCKGPHIWEWCEWNPRAPKLEDLW